MISERNGIKELSIFWNFEIDNTLPKYKQTSAIKNSGTTFIDAGTPEMFNSGDNYFHSSKMNIFKRFILFLHRKFIIKHIQAKKKKENTRAILDFFLSISDNFKQLTPIGEIADTYENALKQAEHTGQVSLKENIENILEVSRSEAYLIQIKLNKYVTENQIIDFYEAVDRDKNLKLTWIKNFVKIIPSELVELKRTLDEKHLFDNYVVLHYDPNNDATNITQEEKEIKKDPILFGLIRNSKKLYYIGDWKDEYCDLTLEDMFNELGEKTLEINNRSLKTYINNGGNYERKRVKNKA